MAEDLIVLDAWPLICYSGNQQPSASAVEQILEPNNPNPAIISAVTLGEVYNATARERNYSYADWFITFLRQALTVDTVGTNEGIQAGWLKTHYYMSLGDSYVAVSALRNNAVLWTGDAELLFDGSPWKVRDLRDDTTRKHHESAIKAGTKKVGPRTNTTNQTPHSPIQLPNQ
ncbi:MAG: hypothetical protein OXE93_08180 [bacterium]|nr:hypothetical protein [bacterium]MCY4257569.1 hypothetical protein [bacterium]